MNARTKRPAILDLGSLMVNAEPQPQAAGEPKAAPKQKDAFRTSVYFHRAVHDKLREIAFEERKSVMDLINEGLDRVLAERGYPTTAELRRKA